MSLEPQFTLTGYIGCVHKLNRNLIRYKMLKIKVEEMVSLKVTVSVRVSIFGAAAIWRWLSGPSDLVSDMTMNAANNVVCLPFPTRPEMTLFRRRQLGVFHWASFLENIYSIRQTLRCETDLGMLSFFDVYVLTYERCDDRGSWCTCVNRLVQSGTAWCFVHIGL